MENEVEEGLRQCPHLGISCLITVLKREKDAVGPYGRWHTTRPSRRKLGWGGERRVRKRERER